VTHVAAGKRIGQIPEVPNILTTPPDEWIKAYKEHMDAVGKSELVPIGFPEDGQSFNDPDLESFLETVKSLKAIGYHVPDYVIEEIQEEIVAGSRLDSGEVTD